MTSFPRRSWVLPCPQLVCLSQSNYRWGVGFIWSLCHDFWGWSWLYRFYGITEGTMLTSHCSLFEQKCISRRHRFLAVVPNLFGTRDLFHGRQFFPWSRVGEMVLEWLNALHLLCILFLLLWYQCHLRSSGIKSQRLGIPALEKFGHYPKVQPPGELFWVYIGGLSALPSPGRCCPSLSVSLGAEWSLNKV